MPYTVPYQRVVTVHRERAASDFLGIKNVNWQAAARDLGAHALLLYMYLASNADGYCLALSPTAVRQAVGMARSTYHDQFVKLVDKGYLVQNSGNGYDFFETPQPRHDNIQKSVSATGLNFEECTRADNDCELPVISNPSENTEINNINTTPNKMRTNISGLEITDEIKVPEEKIVRIKRPEVEAKKTFVQKPTRGEFEF